MKTIFKLLWVLFLVALFAAFWPMFRDIAAGMNALVMVYGLNIGGKL